VNRVFINRTAAIKHPALLSHPTSVTLQGLLHKACHCTLVCGAIWITSQLVCVRAATQQLEAAKPAAQNGATRTGAASTPPEVARTLQAYVGQKVSSVELAGRPELDDRELLPLIVQGAGESLDPDKLERTVAAIKATGKFQDVQLNVIPDVDGVRVLLVLQPGLYFGIYEFPGSKHFPYSRLLQIANYPPEGPYNRSDVEHASAALTKFFQQSGYFLAKVTPGIEPDNGHGIVNIRFEIELGRKAKFGKVALQGASEAQTAALQSKLKSKMARLRGSAIREGKPYSQKSIQNATTYMQSALIKQDFLGAEVKLIGAEYDPVTNRANISFHVERGPLVHVKVEGAHVWKATERKLIPLYQQVGVDDELVQEGRKNLVSHFQSKGYFDAVVETNVDKQGSGETILYRIAKGPKHKVASVSIDGNKVLGDSQLLARSSVRKAKLFSHGAFSEKLLRSSTKSLEAAYRAEGFSEVKVTPRVEGKGSDIDVTFLVKEGVRDTVRELRVVGNDTMPVAQLVPKGLKLLAGQPYSQKHADEDRQNITVKYLESGYLTASFRETVKSTQEDKHSLIVSYEIHEGPRVTTSSVITLGRLHTRQLFIDRAAKFKIGAPLTTGNMLSAESRLYAPGVFDWAEVTTRRQITTQSNEDVLVKVHEARRNTLTYGFGFEVINRGGSLPSGTVAVPGLPPVGLGSNFQASQKTFWGPRGSVEYTRRNILGLAETLTLGTLAGRLVQRVTANFQNPSFRGTSFASNLSASFERNSQNPIFTDRIEQAGFQLQKPLDSKKVQNLFLRYSYSETQITNLIIPQLILSPSDLDVRLSTLSATYSRDTRDNSLDAHRGVFQSVEADFNPAALGSSVSFVKMLAQAAYYKKVRSDIIWANSVRVGFDSAFAGSHVPLSQEFFSGGGSTIRGFPLNGAGPQRPIQVCDQTDPSICSQIEVPEGGRQLLVVNSEFRIPLPSVPILHKGLGVVAFYDGGNVFNTIGFHGQYTNTIGGGLRYATPVGPVRIDIGHNMNSPRGISATQFFITLGQAF
jgi:outer membrane protein insertion porin family